jgi:hypothetical protein
VRKGAASGQASQTRVVKRSRLASPGTATALAVLVVLLAAAFIPLLVVSRQSVSSNADQLAEFLPMAAVGLIVARSQPRNPIGWLLLIAPACVFLTGDAGAYSALVYRLGRHLPLGWVALLLSYTFLFIFVTLPLVVLLFPDGRVPSPRWRWVLRTYLAVFGFLVVSYYAALVSILAAHTVRIDAGGGLAAADSPSGRTAWLSVVQPVIFPVLGVFWLAFVLRLVLSFRGSAGERRQQLKWLLSGSAAAIVSGLIDILVSILDPHAAGWVQAIASLLGLVGFIALPVSIGVAITRYRLYDIDRIISRTLAYAIVTGLLVGLYAGLVLLATQVFRFHSTVAVAAATLAAAALFNPLRGRVQRAVDRRFNRARYDADQTVVAFAARLKDAVDLDSVHDDLAGVVQQALEPAHLSVWVSPRA